MLGRPEALLAALPQTVETPSIEKSADGWVGFCTNSAQQFSDDEVVYLRRVGIAEIDDCYPPGLQHGFVVESFRLWRIKDFQTLEFAEFALESTPTDNVLRKLSGADDLPKFLQLLHHHDHGFPELDPHQRHAHKARILVTVADNQASRRGSQRQSGKELGFAADFQSKIKRSARIKNLLHHLAQLVHLDREHTSVRPPVLKLRDRPPKCRVDRLHPVSQNVLKPDQQRKLKPSTSRLLDDVRQVYCHPSLLKGPRHHVPLGIDVIIARPPAINVVQSARVLDGPG